MLQVEVLVVAEIPTVMHEIIPNSNAEVNPHVTSLPGPVFPRSSMAQWRHVLNNLTMIWHYPRLGLLCYVRGRAVHRWGIYWGLI